MSNQKPIKGCQFTPNFKTIFPTFDEFYSWADPKFKGRKDEFIAAFKSFGGVYKETKKKEAED